MFKRLCFICFTLALLLAACQTRPAPGPTPAPAPVNPTATPTADPIEPTADQPTADQPTADQPTAETPNDPTTTITILYTNDEHGWMEGLEPDASAAHLMGLWQTAEGVSPDSNTLILSGGDMWTGPAISSWFEGESMAELMNAMGYRAAAVGNHEFDFGLLTLRERAKQSSFPFLSANIRNKSDGTTPTEWGIEPYTLVDIDGVTVGIIGLTTVRTLTTTNPTNITSFDFIDYATALREVVPQVQAAGATLIVVPGHLCRDELRDLASAVADLGVHMLGGGHCNELFAEEQNGILLMEGGHSLASYGRALFTIDTATNRVLDVEFETVPNTGASAEATTRAIIEKWQMRTAEELNIEIGSSETGLVRRGQPMQSWVVGSWLNQIPTADVAITNLGGFRADLPAGSVTLGDIITVLPFNNIIIDTTLTGDQLLDLLGFAQGQAAIAGVRQAGPRWLLSATDEPIDPDASYSVLVNDFMYAGGDAYEMLARFDPDAYNTGIDWRQPVIDWTIDAETSAEAPLELAIQTLE